MTTEPTAEGIAAVPEDAADIARKLLDEIVTAHRAEVADALGGLDIDACPHPISIEGDARVIAAAVGPYYQIEAYGEACDALGALASYHEGAMSPDWVDGVRTARKLISEQADAMRAELQEEVES